MKPPVKSILPVLAIAVGCATAGFFAAREFWDVPTVLENHAAPGASVAPTLPEAADPNTDKSTQSSSSTSLEQIRSALADEDVFRGAGAATAWLEAATLEDLRAFVKESQRTFRDGYKPGLQADFREAFLNAFAERLLTQAPEDLKLFADAQTWTLRVAAARMKPELVIAEGSREGSRGPFNQAMATAFEALGERDAAAARKLLDSVTEGKQRLELAMLRGMAVNDPLAAAALLPAEAKEDSSPVSTKGDTVMAIVNAAEHAGPGVLRKLFTDHPDKLASYSNLPLLLLRYPDLANDLSEHGGVNPKSSWMSPQLAREADEMPAEDRAKLFAKYDQMPTVGRDALYAALTAAWARTEPLAATEWALAHAKPEQDLGSANYATNTAFYLWVRTDPAAASAWWEKMPESPLRSRLGAYAGTYLADQGDFDTAIKIFRIGNPQSNDSTLHFAQLYSRRDPPAAATWLSSLPAAAAEQAVPNVTLRYYQSDPDGATAWVESLEPGPVQDKALGQLVRTAAEFDPAGAAERMEQIKDPALRAKASKTVANSWRDDNPAAARAWVEKQPGLDETWRARFLRK
jgi:hypothetical protein